MRNADAIRKKTGHLVATLLASLLTNCAAAPRETFDLSSSEPSQAGRALHGRFTLVVATPDATAPLASDRIVIRTGGQEIAFLAGAQWADGLPKLAQARIIAALERAGVDAARPGDAGGPILRTEIRRFEIDGSRQIAIVEIAAKIADETGKTRAARIFLDEAPSPHTTGAFATRALADAFDAVLVRLARWAPQAEHPEQHSVARRGD